MIPEYAEIPYMFSEVNSGVIVFKNNQTVQDFFSSWRELFYKYFDKMPYDQPTFRVAFWRAKMKSYIMPYEYNIRSKENRKKADRLHNILGEEHLKARIYHIHANNKIGKGVFKITTAAKCLKKCIKEAFRY